MQVYGVEDCGGDATVAAESDGDAEAAGAVGAADLNVAIIPRLPEGATNANFGSRSVDDPAPKREARGARPKFSARTSVLRTARR